jgi:hypothetical protein
VVLALANVVLACVVANGVIVAQTPPATAMHSARWLTAVHRVVAVQEEALQALQEEALQALQVRKQTCIPSILRFSHGPCSSCFLASCCDAVQGKKKQTIFTRWVPDLKGQRTYELRWPAC